MPNVATQTQLVSPTNGTTSYAIQDYEMAKFRQNNGTVSLAVTGPDGNAISTTAPYVEGGTIATGTANLLLFRGTGGTFSVVGTQYPLPVQEQYAPVYEDNTNGVAAVNFKPVASSTYQPSLAVNLGGSLTTLIKASAGNLYSVHYTNLSAAVTYLQFVNVGTVAPIGSAPVYSFPVNGGTSTLVLDNTFFSPSHNFTTGISAVVSIAAGTAGTTGLTAANHILHVHYV